jgi:EAL domain-containing protein (putative c-di-GMP-specific phosphodiesterase class I)/GGDEF domain-containing protein
MYSQTVPYRERLDELRQILLRHGSLGLLLVDVSRLVEVEHDYGPGAFQQVLATASELVSELKGSEVRSSDILAVNDRGGDAFLIFLSPRRHGAPARIADLRATAERVEDHLNRRLARLTSPYLKNRSEVTVAFSMVFFNPLVMPERLVTKLVDEAWECVRVRRIQRDFEKRCRLQEVLLEDQVSTVFQPIVSLREQAVLGYEALSRGPVGTEYHGAGRLFEMASESDMVFELDRNCRRRALAAAHDLPPEAKLFLNVFPAAMFDPEFQGAALIQSLEGLGLSPERIVLEITEKSAIENYTLFVEALQNFTQMGFSVAVDDIGAGYSGLEKIAHLNPRYLKFDIQLIRDIDASFVRREMTRALKNFADKMDSTIIAEGIERDGELQTLLDLGIEYGQGFLLGRPCPRGASFGASCVARAAEA